MTTSSDFRMVGEKSAEILIYQEIGSYFDGLTAKDFAEQLKALGDVDEIHLRINSLGGSVFEGFAIYNLLNQHPAKVRSTIDGIAASIASMIPMAGTEIAMAENAYMMLHEPWTIAIGPESRMLSEAKNLSRFRADAAKAYARRPKITESAALEIMGRNGGEGDWFTAAESIEIGLADTVVEENRAVALRVDRKLYPNAPAALMDAKIGGPAAKEIDRERGERLARNINVKLGLLKLDEHDVQEFA